MKDQGDSRKALRPADVSFELRWVALSSWPRTTSFERLHKNDRKIIEKLPERCPKRVPEPSKSFQKGSPNEGPNRLRTKLGGLGRRGAINRESRPNPLEDQGDSRKVPSPADSARLLGGVHRSRNKLGFASLFGAILAFFGSPNGH